MNCPKCGEKISKGSTHCDKCGNSLKETKNGEKQNKANNMQNVVVSFFTYIFAILTKPIESFKKAEDKFEQPKTTIIFGLILTVIITILNLIKTLLATAHVCSLNWRTGGQTCSWHFENLKSINYIQVIGRSFLIYALIFAVIALVFYLGSLILKKQLSYQKALAITVNSMIPISVGLFILAPIASLIWSELGFIIGTLSVIYSFLIFYELMNDTLSLEKNIKIYFNVACFTLLIVIAYFVLMKVLTSSVISGIGSLLG